MLRGTLQVCLLLAQICNKRGKFNTKKIKRANILFMCISDSFNMDLAKKLLVDTKRNKIFWENI
jgi:hypothetical protein